MESLSQIKTHLAEATGEERAALLEALRADPRKGAHALLQAEEKRQAAAAAERERLQKMLRYEEESYALEAHFVAGVDEAGRGPLAGPVVAAAVILPRGLMIPGLNDSKKLSPQKREALLPQIREQALACAWGVVDAATIDRINILQATFLAMRKALAQLSPSPDRVLVDGNLPIGGLSLPQRPLVGGDGQSLSIAAASVVAKVVRDHHMQEMDALYPGYGFAAHKGYGSREHIEAIRRLGPCPLHRRSFLKSILAESPAGSTHEDGARGEAMVARLLQNKGFRIREHNYRTAAGEIDLIAEKDGMLAFVEVKLRRNARMGSPAQAVDARKQHRIVQAARLYLQSLPRPDVLVRFDVAEVFDGPNPEIAYLADAFRP